MQKQLVYLAGPITGLSYGACVDWRAEVIRLFPEEIIGLSPMRSKTNLLNETSVANAYEDEGIFAAQRGIFAKDIFDCRRCNAILVNFIGAEKVSIGSVMEVSWGHLLNKPVIAAMDSGNIHDHCMLREATPLILPTLEDAVESLIELLLPGY